MFHTVNSRDIFALMECVLLLEDVAVYKNVISEATKCSLQDNATFRSKSRDKILECVERKLGFRIGDFGMRGRRSGSMKDKSGSLTPVTTTLILPVPNQI